MLNISILTTMTMLAGALAAPNPSAQHLSTSSARNAHNYPRAQDDGLYHAEDIQFVPGCKNLNSHCKIIFDLYSPVQQVAHCTITYGLVTYDSVNEQPAHFQPCCDNLPNETNPSYFVDRTEFDQESQAVVITLQDKAGNAYRFRIGNQELETCMEGGTCLPTPGRRASKLQDVYKSS